MKDPDSAQEWMGATVFAGAALEALLLCGLKQRESSEDGRRRLDLLDLAQFIDRAKAEGLIDEATASQARLAKDARNLIHPGRSARLGVSCDRGTALTALAGLDRVAADLARIHAKTG